MSESARWRMWLSRLLAYGLYVPVVACSLFFMSKGSVPEGSGFVVFLVCLLVTFGPPNWLISILDEVEGQTG